MGDPEQHEIPFRERRFKNARFRRGVFLVPALFTSANLLCGYFAVVAALMGTTADFDRAAKAIGLAILFDSLDGRLARLPSPGEFAALRLPGHSVVNFFRIWDGCAAWDFWFAARGGWRDLMCKAWRQVVQSISSECPRLRLPE
jgi:hypothetical protein